MFLSRGLALAVSTTPAAWVSPESRPDASLSTFSTDLPAPATCASIWRRSFSFRSPTCISASTKKRKPELGRQPSGRGVWRIDQAELLQVRHHVAHRGGRQRRGDQPRQVARAERLAGRQVAFDDLPKDFARALVELRQADLRPADGDVLGHPKNSVRGPQNCPFGRIGSSRDRLGLVRARAAASLARLRNASWGAAP